MLDHIALDDLSVSNFSAIAQNRTVSEYGAGDRDLDRLVRWVKSDDMLRTEEELLTEMMRELGFQRRGKNVVARLSAATRRNK